MVRLAVLTVLFYALHSLLAMLTVKEWAGRYLGLVGAYRAVYTLVAMGTTVLVWWAYRSVSVHATLWEVPPVVRVAGFAAIALGSLLAGAAILRTGALGFIGLMPEKHTGLLRTGLHGCMRHPIYAGVILVALGWIAWSPSPPTALVVAITFLYLPVGIASEERKLVAQFGDAYLNYRRQVPALWPRCSKMER